ncbi:hypothetical protein QJS10_CPA03g00940 [Acorus calamus]|uniref:Uncharacterized protein n=1 Tax=Acorus calamus TaxID=4465 RepID=A0AAV9F833_ACOCL|nr:hypothetical protein QJS10_CPA03g00940 [Acorus calamus]
MKLTRTEYESLKPVTDEFYRLNIDPSCDWANVARQGRLRTQATEDPWQIPCDWVDVARLGGRLGPSRLGRPPGT